MNTIAMFAPDNLNKEELTETFELLYDIIDDSKFNFLLYRTIDIEMIRFFLELPDKYASHLKIHVVDRVNTINNKAVKQGLEYLMENGTEVREHFFRTEFLTDEPYDEILKEIVMESDEVLSFYNYDPLQISKLLRPFNHSKKYKKNGYIKHLGTNKEIELVPFV